MSADVWTELHETYRRMHEVGASPGMYVDATQRLIEHHGLREGGTPERAPAEPADCANCPTWQRWGGGAHNAPTAPLCAASDHWAPAPLRWRVVRPGDMILGGDGQAWMVVENEASPAGRFVRAVRGAAEHKADVDPDAPAGVLIPASEREALIALREGGAGAQVLVRTI